MSIKVVQQKHKNIAQYVITKQFTQIENFKIFVVPPSTYVLSD